MEKNTNSVTENPALLTELTETEMESTTGGLLTRGDFNNWLNAYKNGTLNYAAVYQTLLSEPVADRPTDIRRARRWFRSLPPGDKNIVRSLYQQVKVYLQS